MDLCKKKIDQLREDVAIFTAADSQIHAETEVELESDMRVSLPAGWNSENSNVTDEILKLKFVMRKVIDWWYFFQFQEFLESQLPRDNVRIHVEKISSHTSVYENEGPDNDGVYNREEMKAQAQRLIDLKERRVKKVVKKKGK